MKLTVVFLGLAASLLLAGCHEGSPAYPPSAIPSHASGKVTTDLSLLTTHKAAAAQIDSYKHAGYVISGLHETDASDGTVRALECTAVRKQSSVTSTIQITTKGVHQHVHETTRIGTDIVSITDTNSS